MFACFSLYLHFCHPTLWQGSFTHRLVGWLHWVCPLHIFLLLTHFCAKQELGVVTPAEVSLWAGVAYALIVFSEVRQGTPNSTHPRQR